MGLDVTVHLHAQPCTPAERAILDMSEDRWQAADDLGLTLVFHGSFEARSADLTEPAYRVGESRSVYSWSYSGYPRWRDQLAVLAGIELSPDPGGWRGLSLHAFWSECEFVEATGKTPEYPFWQLIHFSDCDGNLGPAACASLAKDFDDHAEKAADLDDRFRCGYDAFREAFGLAAATCGWVEFH